MDYVVGTECRGKTEASSRSALRLNLANGRPMRLSSMPKHSPAKHAKPTFSSVSALQRTLNRWLRAFSGEVDTGSPSENATTQREKSEARFYQNGIRFSDESGAAAVEYSLLIAFISLAILAAIESVSGGISGVATKLTTTLAGM